MSDIYRDARLEFLVVLREAMEGGAWVKLTLGRRGLGAEAELVNIYARPVQLKRGPMVAVVWRYRTRDITKNLTAAEAGEAVAGWLGEVFLDAHLYTDNEQVELRAKSEGRWQLKRRAVAGRTVAGTGVNRAAVEKVGTGAAETEAAGAEAAGAAETEAAGARGAEAAGARGAEAAGARGVGAGGRARLVEAKGAGKMKGLGGARASGGTIATGSEEARGLLGEGRAGYGVAGAGAGLMGAGLIREGVAGLGVAGSGVAGAGLVGVSVAGSDLAGAGAGLTGAGLIREGVAGLGVAGAGVAGAGLAGLGVAGVGVAGEGGGGGGGVGWGGHDRAKRHALPAGAAWLRELGVTNEAGRPREAMAGKLRQIQKFAEVLAHAVEESGLGMGRIRIADMGCGKGYLTFATAALLGERAEVTGVERRAELVTFCNGVAERLGFIGLRFKQGDIKPEAEEGMDGLIALHACDTATDDALAAGVKAGAALLVVSPCCHKEVRGQLTAPEVLAEALRHGIFQEREAEFVTDAIRAQLLEWSGYRTKVFEFISTEHTAKNVMIVGVRRSGKVDEARRDRVASRLRALAAFYGVKRQRLAGLLGFALA